MRRNRTEAGSSGARSEFRNYPTTGINTKIRIFSKQLINLEVFPRGSGGGGQEANASFFNYQITEQTASYLPQRQVNIY